jgi:hypothetical protein
LVDESNFDDKKYESIRKNIFEYLEKQFEESKKIVRTIEDYKIDNSKGSKTLTKKWKDMDFSCFSYQEVNTGIDIERLKQIGLASVTFNYFRFRLQKIFRFILELTNFISRAERHRSKMKR